MLERDEGVPDRDDSVSREAVEDPRRAVLDVGIDLLILAVHPAIALKAAKYVGDGTSCCSDSLGDVPTPVFPMDLRQHDTSNLERQSREFAIAG